jgi:YD repeat-containing protein
MNFKLESRYVGNSANAYHLFPTQYLGSYCVDESGINRYGDEYVLSHYSQNTGAMRKIGFVEYQYKNGDITNYVRKQSDEVYDSDKLQVISSTENRSSSPEQNVTIIRYPFSYGTISPSATGNAKALLTLQNKNVLNIPVETYHYVQNGATQYITSGQVTTFLENAANTSYIVPDQIYLLETANELPSYTPTAINGTSSGITMDSHYPAESRIKFTTFDVNGNMIDIKKVNDKSMAYVWGYNNTLPIAEVVNADISKVNIVATTSFAFNPAITSSMSGFVKSPNFAIDFTQNATIGIQYNRAASPPAGSPYVDVKLVKDDGTVVFGPTRYYYSAYSPTPPTISPSLAPGTYAFYYLGEPFANTGMSLRIDMSYQWWEKSCKVFHTSFEENGANSTEARTGIKVWNGAYTFRLPSQNGTYALSYWQKSATPGGGWTTLNEQTITITGANAGTNMTIGSSGNIIDEVRLFPTNALMTTYTYDPLLGMTTTTDPANITTYYTYDSFGRLMSIKDDKQKILKNYQYQYNATPSYVNPEN